MLFKVKADDSVDYKFDDLKLELKRMLKEMKNGNLKVRGNTRSIDSKNVVSQEVIEDINKMLELMHVSDTHENSETKVVTDLKIENEDLKNKVEKLNTRSRIVTKMTKVGLWDMDVISDDPVNGNNKFIWSDEFRRLLGFSNESDFPNKLNSWSDRIHPGDLERTLKAFKDHIMDYSGRTPYSLDYRLKLKSGEYRWFHAEGDTTRDKSGFPKTVLGSIIDITDIKTREEKNVELSKKMEGFTEAISEIVKSVDSIAATAQDLAESQQNTMEESEKLKTGTKETQKIIEFIKNLSGQINLLGLNASIEAARSGKEGLGFNVVATEIRKLALSSSDAVKQIEDSIKDMNNSIQKITQIIENVNGITQTQASTTEEVNAYAEELSSNAEELLQTAKDVIA